MKILYYGPCEENSGSRFEGMQHLGHTCRIVDPAAFIRSSPRVLRAVEGRLRNGPFVFWLNRRLLRAATRFRPDIVWLEKGVLVYPRTLRGIKDRIGAILVASHSDDFLDKVARGESRHFNRSIPLYDVIFTPREVNFPELYQRGARHVAKFWKGYANGVVGPRTLNPEEQVRFGCDVAFAGRFEPSRLEPCVRVAALAQELGFTFKLWGPRWGTCPSRVLRSFWCGHLSLKHYVKALCGAKIAVHFLSRWRRDTQDSRTFEIPATRTFMLAERSDDHLACFQEGKEAEFFSTVDEMVAKITYYLKHDGQRAGIGAAGYERCLRSGYSNRDRVREMLLTVEKLRCEQENRSR